MQRRRHLCAALSAAWVLTAGGVALAAANVNPPAGTPNMAAMILQPSDLAPGAVSILPPQLGYVAPPMGFTAQFDGGFTTAATSDGVSYYSISDFVAIAPSAATVSAFFGHEVQFFRSKVGHKLLSAVIVMSAGRKAQLKAKNIKYGNVGTIGVGQNSFLETIGVSRHHVSVHEDVVLIQQGTAYGLLILDGNPGEQIPRSDAKALATAMDAHINAISGASGSAISTASSAASGASGSGRAGSGSTGSTCACRDL